MLIVSVALGVILGGVVLGLFALGVSVLIADDMSDRAGARRLGLSLIAIGLAIAGLLGLIAYAANS